MTFALSTILVYGQVKLSNTLEIDTLTKVLGLLFAIGGFFMGYIQLKMSNKIAELDARFTKALTEVKEDFKDGLRKETEKLETKIQLSSKEIEAKMATHHDIDNLKTVMKLQHENTQLSNESLKEQLKTAANIYKRDRE